MYSFEYCCTDERSSGHHWHYKTASACGQQGLPTQAQQRYRSSYQLISISARMNKPMQLVLAHCKRQAPANRQTMPCA
jgi:hypothetical protein